MIGFIYPGDPAEPDGAQVFLDNPRVDTSINAALLTAGLVYPAFYDTLPADLRARTPPATWSSWPRCPTPPGSTAVTKPSP